MAEEMSAEHYAQMDAGVREFVRFLNRQGYETYQSCQGGACHVYKWATVLLRPKNIWQGVWLVLSLAVTLKIAGFEYFWVSYRREYVERADGYDAYQTVLIELPFWKTEFRRRRWIEPIL